MNILTDYCFQDYMFRNNRRYMLYLIENEGINKGSFKYRMIFYMNGELMSSYLSKTIFKKFKFTKTQTLEISALSLCIRSIFENIKDNSYPIKVIINGAV